MTSPHKSDDIPLLRVPSMGTQNIQTDPMHSFHLGWGMDLAASGIVLLCSLEVFGRGSLNSRLARAFDGFKDILHDLRAHDIL